MINQQQKGSFSDFLNAFRIKEVQDLLRSDKAKQLTILAVAFEAGFNSKTAFYNAFKKFTGKTPSQFMKEQG
jgi:AraC-like DNA-binding protein